jgi:DNA-directed RNA polymerase specialized sigma24 family protein
MKSEDSSPANIAAKLHRDLVDNSPIASAQLAELLLPIIFKILKQSFYNISDPHLIQTAVNDALLAYLKNPSSFDPDRGNLIGYVAKNAKWKLLNALSQEKRSLILHDDVELESYLAVSLEGGADDQLITEEEDELTNSKLKALLPDKTDRALLSAMMNGIRDTKYFATILEVSHEPEDIQAEIVKRHKDRIKILLKRKYKRNND